MKKILLLLVVFGMFVFVGCGSDNPIVNNPDTGDTADTVDTADTSDTGNTGDTSDTSDTGNTGDTADSGDTSDTGDTNVGKHCEKDPDCGAGLICVNQTCSMGCKDDAECKTYGSLRCNTKLGRCLNLAASSQACSESKCPTGCCYSNDGFTELKCATDFSVGICGMCPQGQVFRGGNECVPAVCSSTNDKCQTYNSSEPKVECFECQAGALICYENPDCGTGTGSGVVVNALSCTPAGQVCSTDSDCCSGQPCIQGYCY